MHRGPPSVPYTGTGNRTKFWRSQPMTDDSTISLEMVPLQEIGWELKYKFNRNRQAWGLKRFEIEVSFWNEKRRKASDRTRVNLLRKEKPPSSIFLQPRLRFASMHCFWHTLEPIYCMQKGNILSEIQYKGNSLTEESRGILSHWCAIYDSSNKII